MSGCKLVGWCVRVWVRGIDAGRYDFATEAEARTDFLERSAMFRVLGCEYQVKPVYRIETGGAA